jgi:hypothetical protein
MNQLDLKLYELLGDKTLSFGCVVKSDAFRRVLNYDEREDRIEIFLQERPYDSNSAVLVTGTFEILGHTPTIADFHRWIFQNGIEFEMENEEI